MSPPARRKQDARFPRRTGNRVDDAARSRRAPQPLLHTVRDFCETMQAIAPTGLAQSWDNVGLITGDPEAIVRRAMLAIDLTRPVLKEAVDRNVDMLMAYHPPIFKPVHFLRSGAAAMEGLVFECIRAGIAIYSSHTALDAAEGGTNDVLAELCGAVETRPLFQVDAPGPALLKIVVYVPPENADVVAESLFAAGAGHIGRYSHCSFRAPGTGTFLGGPGTNPAIGERGRLERVEELRLETILPQQGLAEAVEALRKAHPYEEPAFDVYALKSAPTRGIGRSGKLAKPMALAALAKRLIRATKAEKVQMVGRPKQYVDRVLVIAGAAGSLPFQFSLTPRDAIVTGEIRHHDALAIGRIGCAAVALGHWASERPVLNRLAARLAGALPEMQIQVSRADAAPFQ